ncbi:MAG: CAP domain-containing protein [Syntrophobacteraceae bacterium]
MRSLRTLLLFMSLALFAIAVPDAAFGIPPIPSSRPPVRPDASEVRKASDLYVLARKENRRLRWDQCLSLKAFIRAKQLVTKGYFEHEDPATGRNPAWELVQRCLKYRFAGENLAKGMDTPANIHSALMNSRLHRKNILDRRFQRIGIGCYDYVCVQLFAGL